MIKVNKKWFSFEEVLKLHDLTEDDLFYLGIIGQLEFGVNWKVIDSNMLNEDLESGYRFSKGDSDGVDRPDSTLDPLNRIALLSCDQIEKLQRNLSIRLYSAFIDDIKLSVSLREYTNKNSPIVISKKDIVITARSIQKYIEKVTADKKSNLKHIAKPQTHTSELLQVLYAVINEFWEGKPNLSFAAKRATNDAVQSWVINKFPEVSSSMAKNLARIARPNKFK